tara:strand:- start:3850 stop:4479 length:630 start_codon:yes stop_codon:yes gene_type:complete
MSHYKNKFFITFFLFSLSLNAQYEININYESGFEYQSQVILAKDLQNELSKKGIVNLIKKQDWIDNYSIVFTPFQKKVFINIKNKNPLFVLNSEYFYDKDLSRFEYDQSSNNLIKVNGNISEVEDILFLIELVESNKLMDLKIDRIEYGFVNGWDVKTKSILIRFGKDISQQRVKNFKDTLNYVYEIRKIPSIIDMRYRDGVALSYGKQ